MLKLKVTVQGGKLQLDKKFLKQVMRAAGGEVAGVARRLIRQGGASGRLYRGHRASATGQAPASQSGQLARSLKVVVFRSGEGVAIRDTARSPRGSGAPYALFLEKGARGGKGSGRKGIKGQRNKRGAPSSGRVLQPRPFLTTALDSRQASIARRIATAINSGLKFERMKR